jgi:hypothetical protein
LRKPDKTELEREIKRWSNVLGEIDRGIAMPESLKGSALRAKLDEVPERGRFPAVVDVFRYRPVLSYAVMFVLVVAVVFVFRAGFGDERLAQNYDAGWADPQTAAPAPIAAADYAEPFDLAVMPGTEEAFSLNDNFDYDADYGGAVPEAAAGGAVNMRNGILYLGERAGHAFSWHQGSVDVLRLSDSEGLRIELPDMSAVTDLIADEDYLILIGTAHDGATLVRSYTGLSALAPGASGTALHLDTHIATRIYQGVVYTVSYSPMPSRAEPETQSVIILDGSTETGFCRITAMDIATGDLNAIYVFDSGSDVTLSDRYVHIAFNADSAIIPLNGMTIG